MHSRTSSKSGLFLIELIIVILFFAVASAICVRLFAHAHLTAEKGRDLNQAVFLAESAAETVKGTDCSADTMESVLGASSRGGDGYEVYYDGDWQLLPSQNGASYQMIISLEPGSGPVLTAGVSVFHVGGDWEEIYRLDVKKYAA